MDAVKQPISDSLASHTSSSGSERLHALDGLRAAAMFLGVALHAAIPYMENWSPWCLRDGSPNAAFDIFVVVVHGFRMQLFFFLSGYFARLVFLRRGAGGFLKHRGRRIGIPFAIGLVTLVPVILVIWVWGQSVAPDPLIREMMEDPTSVWQYPTFHLWFLECLLVFCAVATLWGYFEKRLDAAGKLAALDRCFGRVVRSWWKPFAMSLLVVPFLIDGPIYGEADAVGESLLMRPEGLLYQGAFFAFGWWLHRDASWMKELQRFQGFYFLCAIPALLVFIWGFSVVELGDANVESYLTVGGLGLLGSCVYAWAMIFGLTGFFLRRCAGHSCRARYFADSSYWFYLAHLPLVCGLQILVHDWPVSVFLKFGLVMVVATAWLLATYERLVRYSFIGSALNGPRKRETRSMDSE